MQHIPSILTMPERLGEDRGDAEGEISSPLRLVSIGEACCDCSRTASLPTGLDSYPYTRMRIVANSH